jgi:hypothetical protein
MTKHRSTWTRTLVCAVSILALLGTGFVGVATASTNGWVFTGSLTTPVRDSDGRVAIKGRLTVPACADQQRGCWLAVHRVESGLNAGWQEIQTSGTRLVFRTAGVYDISGWAYLTEGTWDVGVVAGLDSQGKPQGVVVASGLTSTVSVPGVRVTRVVTQASAPSVVQGETLTISVAEEVTWTDEVITFRTVEGYKELAWRPTGAGLWDRVDKGSEEFVVSPAAPGDYRMVVDGAAAEPIFVNVYRPTNAHRISDSTASATSAIANSVVSVAGRMETQYDDKEWRPSPVGTRYELQFLADGSQAWARLLSSTVREAGIVDFRFKMLTTGRYRIAAGDATGLSVRIEEIVPVAVPAIEPLALPTTVAPGEPIDVNLGVDVEYSDGEVRDIPDGTDYVIDFAPVSGRSTNSESVERAKPRWRQVAKGKTRDGQIAAQIRPRVSGYWRIRVGKAVTPRVLVKVQRR